MALNYPNNPAENTVIRAPDGVFHIFIAGEWRKRINNVKAPVVGNVIDLAKGDYHTLTGVSGALTLSIANPLANAVLVQEFILDITGTGALTVTWPAGVVGEKGVKPALTGNGRDLLVFTSADGGATWVVKRVMEDVR